MSKLVSNMPQFKTVGSILKYYRELKGYTIDDISSKTYIKVKYLQALEDGNNQILPPSFFVLSYIKHYAKILELEAEYLIGLYKEEFNIKDNNSNFSNFDSKINKYNNETESNKMDLDEFFDDNKNHNINKDKPIIEDKPFFIKEESKNIELKENNMRMDNNQELKKEANDLILEAKRQAEEIISNAKNQANVIINQANKVRIESYIYADDLFKKLETEISKMLKEVRNGRDFLKDKKTY